MSGDERTLTAGHTRTHTNGARTTYFEVTERIPEFDIDDDHEFTQRWVFRVDPELDVARLDYFEQDGESYHHSIDDIPADVVDRVEQEGYELEEQ